MDLSEEDLKILIDALEFHHDSLLDRDVYIDYRKKIFDLLCRVRQQRYA